MKYAMKSDKYELLNFPKARLSTIDMGKLAHARHYMFGLIEVDVTAARQKARKLRKNGAGPSFTAWIIKAIADCIQKNKHVHAMLFRKRKLVVFEDIDVAIPVEKQLGGDRVPLPLLIKQVNTKDAAEIQKELDAASHRNIGDEKDYILGAHAFSKTALKLYYFLPQWARLFAFRWIFNDPFRAKRHSGTVLLTTVNAIGRASGWILPSRTMHNLSISLGSITKKPWAVEGTVQIREIMNVTVTFNHDVIDGMPALAFIRDLVRVIENVEEGGT